MRMMKWNGMRVLKWKWIRVSVIGVVDWKNGMGMDGNGCIKNMDDNRNEKQR